MAATAGYPLLQTVWQSLHRQDLRFAGAEPTFVGLANYLTLLGDERFWGALARTAAFALVSVGLELLLGLLLALLLQSAARARGLLRMSALLPWALPTVVVALVCRFLFDGATAPVGLAYAGLLGGAPPAWFADGIFAWVPIVCADVWKTTPFVALLLLAGLEAIDPSLYEAARCDGAHALGRFWHITLPLLRPALLVALLFRLLDALRVFDLIYVLTAGGPGTATEPIALYTFSTLFRNLRFGFGSALSVSVFLISFVLACLYVRAMGVRAGEAGR